MATILQITNADRNLSLFAKGLKLSGLQDQLNELGPFTILGPVNFALDNLIALNYDALLWGTNKKKLADFLATYIICGKTMLSDFRDNQSLQTLTGQTVKIIIKNGEIFINGARLRARDWQGSNGVIHVLDRAYSD